MTKYTWIKQESDAEIYEISGQHVKFVWRFSTGSETGQHNLYDTEKERVK